MSIAFKILKKLLIFTLSVIVAGVIIILVWRMISSGNPSDLETLTPNDSLLALYNKDGENMKMIRQEQRSITSAEDNYGYFSVTDCKIIPDANQIQLLFRYNNSTLKRTAEDHGLSEVPSRSDNVYEVSLLFAIDLTPDNPDDNLSTSPESVRFVRCYGEEVASKEKNLYNYRRIVYSTDSAELDLSALIDEGLLLAVYADICYTGNIDYDKPDGVLCLYDFKSAVINVKLEKKDIEALENYKASH